MNNSKIYYKNYFTQTGFREENPYDEKSLDFRNTILGKNKQYTTEKLILPFQMYQDCWSQVRTAAIITKNGDFAENPVLFILFKENTFVDPKINELVNSVPKISDFIDSIKLKSDNEIIDEMDATQIEILLKYFDLEPEYFITIYNNKQCNCLAIPLPFDLFCNNNICPLESLYSSEVRITIDTASYDINDIIVYDMYIELTYFIVDIMYKVISNENIKKDINIKDNCSICTEDIIGDSFNTKCNHTFHLVCLQAWSSTLDKDNEKERHAVSCPNCRTQLSPKDLILKPELEYSLIIEPGKKILYDEILLNTNYYKFGAIKNQSLQKYININVQNINKNIGLNICISLNFSGYIMYLYFCFTTQNGEIITDHIIENILLKFDGKDYIYTDEPNLLYNSKKTTKTDGVYCIPVSAMTKFNVSSGISQAKSMINFSEIGVVSLLINYNLHKYYNPEKNPILNIYAIGRNMLELKNGKMKCMF